jgi:spermidine/putrescine transport system ATP-binding protein
MTKISELAEEKLMNEFAVEMRDVVKRFITPEGNELSAVDHVTMQIKNGEFFSMLGSSGCGKTTSLRMIAGFEWPTEGEVYIEGKPMGHTPPFQRKVNTVFQSYALFQHMTVYQNIAFGLEMEGAAKDEIEKRVKRALEMVQLTGMERRRPKQLSGGQQQRVAVARSLVKVPDVLLLDEPLGALDLKLRKEMQLELKALQQQLGITFIYVTHDQEEAMTMSDRIAVMSKGKVQQMGTPVEIYERPSNRFVADFIGESNFLEGKLKTLSGKEACVIVPELNAELNGIPVSEGLVVGDDVTVSIRPEKVHISDKPLDTNSFTGKVTNTVYIGTDTHVFVDVMGKRIKVFEQNRISRLDPGSFYTVGQDVTLVMWPDNVLVLKKD